jgi:hypothetical protein
LERLYRAEYLTVLSQVKIIRPHDIRDLIPATRIHQQAAKHRLLGFRCLRRYSARLRYG